jgi:quercetin dioxygenase-like cupin family protein
MSMHLNSNFTENKTLQTKKLFSLTDGLVISIKLMANAELKEHITKTPALLLGIVGEVVFENEKGIKEIIGQGDYIEIEPNVKHRLIAKTDSNLILIK